VESVPALFQVYRLALAEGMITIFSTPKPFNDSQNRRERNFRNAVGSWQELRPKPEIAIFGGERVIVEELGAKWIMATPSNKNGLPYIDGMFALAQSMAHNDILMFANDDMVFLPDLVRAVYSAASRFKSFLMIGQRWDVDVPDRVDFGSRGWEQQLRSQVIRHGRLHPVHGKDYFVFRRPLGLNVPPLLVGRPQWDNWMVSHALGAGIPVIDASLAVTAIHQNHDYSHNPGGVHITVSRCDEFLYNIKLGSHWGHISDATWTMSAQGEIYRRGTDEWNR